MEAFATPNREASTVATQLVDNVFFRLSMPSQLHSDMGAQFESQLMHEVSKILGIKKTHTTPYHTQCDGLVERLNRTIAGMLATMLSDYGGEWERHLAKVCFAYNTSIHASTGFTPFYLLYGRQARIPVDIIYGTPTKEPSCQCQYARSLRHSLEQAYVLARQKLQTAAQRQKLHYDQKIHGDPFQVNDLVWLCNPAVTKGKSHKLRCPWVGPYRVIKKISDIVYRIQDTQRKKRCLVVHFDRLKLCDPDTRVQQSVPAT